MTSPKQLLESAGLSPKKSLGQNFLHDPNTLAAIVTSADLPPDATVLEIGPGLGALTQYLAQTAHQVICIETDQRLQPLLTQQLAPYNNVRIEWIDFLDADVQALIGENDFYVVANLPYYITSAILRKLLDAPHRPRHLVLTVQKEVAERILAKTGDMNLLSVSVQFYGTPQHVMYLKPAVFWPRPDVDSAVIRIDINPTPHAGITDSTTFFKLVRAGFSQKRKQLKNSLANGLGITNAHAEALLNHANIQPSRRAETLSLDEWAALLHAYTQSEN